MSDDGATQQGIDLTMNTDQLWQLTPGNLDQRANELDTEALRLLATASLPHAIRAYNLATEAGLCRHIANRMRLREHLHQADVDRIAYLTRQEAHPM